MKIYYAHPLSLFNTPTEKRDVKTLESLGLEVVNPNHPDHQAGYEQHGMEYFRAIVAGCDAVAFRAFPEGSIGAGVHKEITEFAETKPVIELPCGVARRGLTVEETREHLGDCGQR